jgi:hypothetical protein
VIGPAYAAESANAANANAEKATADAVANLWVVFMVLSSSWIAPWFIWNAHFKKQLYNN